jgi:hypothetical protein
VPLHGGPYSYEGRCATTIQEHALQLHITGEIRPETLRSHDRGEIIATYEDALAAVVACQHPTLKPGAVTVGLVNVAHGSVALAFATPLPEVVLPAAATLTRVIQAGAWADLPIRALKALHKLVQYAGCHDLALQFRTVQDDEAISAIITKETVIPATISLFGQTEIIAEVKRVGGDEPKVMLRTLQGETLFCDTTEEVAKHLGSFLYEQVKLAGAAEWDLESLTIVEFEIATVLPYQRTSPVQAFAALREQFGSFFDNIDDPDTWAVETRRG